jgi:hypothetical protein
MQQKTLSAPSMRSWTKCKLGIQVQAVFGGFPRRGDQRENGARAFPDGRVSAVVGSHTHVPTADSQILPGGTGYLTDVGMCGDYDTVIGMEKQPRRRVSPRSCRPSGWNGRR